MQQNQSSRLKHPKHEYSHGLPFNQKLGENLDSLIDRVKNNKASLIIIDGGVGEGKTTLGVECADYVNAAFGLPKIEYDQQLAVGGADFTKKLRSCHEQNMPALIYDEAGDFDRRGALSRFNQNLNRTFDTFRGFKILVFLILPSFKIIDQPMFDKNIPRMLIHCEKRNNNYGCFRGFSLYRMLYVRKRMEKLTVKGFAYNLVEPNFHGTFLNLDKKREKALDRFSVLSKKDILLKSEIKMAGLINYYDASKKLNRSVIWVKKIVSKLKIKHVKVIKKQRYFDEAIISILGDYIDDVNKDE